MKRFLCGAIAVALLLLTRTTRADTIIATLQSVTPSGGNFVYVYQISLTSSFGLANDSGFESGLIMMDFNGLVGGPGLSASGTDITAAGDWATGTPATGGAPLTNVFTNTPAAGLTEIVGNNPTTFAFATDGAASNIVLKYTGADVLPSASPRNLIHLTLTSSIGLVLLEPTLSRDTGPDQANRPVETFSYLAPNEGGGPFLPLPATANMGLILLGGLGGIGGLRRLNSRRSVVA